VSPTLRAQRLRLPWLLVPLFLLLARPTPLFLCVGSLVALPGLVLRVLASGHIWKDRALAVHGPYAHIRHPLYTGSFLIGLGIVLASGVLMILPVYLLLFFWLYSKVVRREDQQLNDLFGEAFREYRRQTPAVLPRARSGATPGGRMPPSDLSGSVRRTGYPEAFRRDLFLFNRGWEAPLGALLAFGILWGKVLLAP
jgi:hypothetical protein